MTSRKAQQPPPPLQMMADTDAEQLLAEEEPEQLNSAFTQSEFNLPSPSYEQPPPLEQITSANMIYSEPSINQLPPDYAIGPLNSITSKLANGSAEPGGSSLSHAAREESDSHRGGLDSGVEMGDACSSQQSLAATPKQTHFASERPTVFGEFDGSSELTKVPSARKMERSHLQSTLVANGNIIVPSRDRKESTNVEEHHIEQQQRWKRHRRRHYTDPVDFEGILNIIGGCSWWQIWIYFIISLQQVPHAMFNLSVVYMMFKPDHWCAIPDIHNNGPLTKGHTYEDHKWDWSSAVNEPQFLYPPKPNTQPHLHDQCHYYDYGDAFYRDMLDQHSQEEMMNRTRMIHQNSTPDNRVPTRSCQKWEFNTSVMEVTIVTQWDLVCDDNLKRAHAHAAYSLGFLFGCLLGGFASDRFGRKPTVIGFGILSSMFGLILPYSTYFPMFLLIRFLGAVCNEGADLAAYVLCMEITGMSYRAMVGSLLQAPWAVGYALLALVAYITRNWHTMQIITATLHTGTILLICILPESPRWLIVNNRVREAERIIRKATEYNKTQLPPDLELVKHAEQRNWVKRNERANILHLMKSKSLITRTLVIFVVWIAIALVYYGLVISLSEKSGPGRSLFSGNFFINNAIAGAIELPTLLGCVFLLRFGRKKSQLGTLLFAGVFIICAMLAIHFKLAPNGVILVLLLFGKVCIQAAFVIIYIFTSEMYPTVIRNSAVGICSMIARIGSGVSSYVATMSDSMGEMPMAIFGAFSLVASLLVMLLPETKDQPLPDTLRDAVVMAPNLFPGLDDEALLQSGNISVCVDHSIAGSSLPRRQRGPQRRQRHPAGPTAQVHHPPDPSNAAPARVSATPPVVEMIPLNDLKRSDFDEASADPLLSVEKVAGMLKTKAGSEPLDRTCA